MNPKFKLGQIVFYYNSSDNCVEELEIFGIERAEDNSIYYRFSPNINEDGDHLYEHALDSDIRSCLERGIDEQAKKFEKAICELVARAKTIE